MSMIASKTMSVLRVAMTLSLLLWALSTEHVDASGDHVARICGWRESRRFIISIGLIIYPRNTWYQGMLEWNSQLKERRKSLPGMSNEMSMIHTVIATAMMILFLFQMAILVVPASDCYII